MSEKWPKFKKFTLLKQIGAGGMGTIYLSQISSGPGAGRIVVLKCVSPEHAKDTQYRSLFESEIRLMLGFSHPNIVTLLDVGEENDCLYFTLDWIEGKNLKEILSATKSEKLSPDIALNIAIEAAQVFNYAHTYFDRVANHLSPVVHRDVSPSNIIVGYDGRVRILDFGIAKSLATPKDQPTAALMGKARYMSPEQFRGQTVDVRTDIFSLAIVLWESLTGKMLFENDSGASPMWNIMNIDFPIPPASTHVSDLPRELDVILLKALHRDRSFRFASMAEFGEALQKVLRQLNPDFRSEETAFFLKTLFAKELVRERLELSRLCAEKTKVRKEVEDDEVTTIIVKAPIVGNFESLKAKTERIQRSTAPSHLAAVLFDLPASGVKEIALEAPGRPRLVPTAYRVRSSDEFTVTEKKTYHLRIIGGFLFFLSSFFLYKYNEKVGGIFKHKEAKMTLSRPPSLVQYVQIAEVQLEIHPQSAHTTIRVGDVPLSPSVKSFNIPFETPTRVTVEHPGFLPLVREISIASESVQPIQLELDLVPEKWGTLSLNTNLSAEVTITSGDLSWQAVTPLDGLVVPEGNYTVKIKSPWQPFEKTITASVKEGQAVHLEEQIQLTRVPASK